VGVAASHAMRVQWASMSSSAEMAERGHSGQPGIPQQTAAVRAAVEGQAGKRVAADAASQRAITAAMERLQQAAVEAFGTG
jgi:hypothetical protein